MISACSMRDSVSELFILTPLEVVGAIKLLVAMLAEQWLLVKLEMVINSVTPDSRLAILLIPLFPGNVENQLQDNCPAGPKIDRGQILKNSHSQQFSTGLMFLLMIMLTFLLKIMLMFFFR